MKLENTRSLGVGETVESTDWIFIGDDALPVKHLAGEIITGDEGFEVRRPLYNPIAEICTQYGIDTDMGKAALSLMLENVALLDRKQRDYASQNIAAFGEYGILGRVWDKVSRLRNLSNKQEQPNNESIDDTWQDLANYAVLAQLVRKGLWK